MPFGILILVAGLVLAFATTYVTLGWILVALGITLIVVPILLFGALVKSINPKRSNHRF